jgi:hypothetical protein
MLIWTNKHKVSSEKVQVKAAGYLEGMAQNNNVDFPK